ncbi:MAG: AAA family ATPase, partial [Gammaproteobacteria bacterium]
SQENLDALDKVKIDAKRSRHLKHLPKIVGAQDPLNFAIGNSDFEKIMNSNNTLIDKTLFIKDFLEDGAEVKLILRPRRFGKTLMMSMLRSFFSIKNPETNRTHFEKLKIASACIRKNDGSLVPAMNYQGTLPVIFLTFKDVKQMTYNEAEEKIKEIISGIYEDFKEDLFDKANGVLKAKDKNRDDYQMILDRNPSPNLLSGAIKNLTKLLEKQYKVKPLLLIDEYDTPIQCGYENNFYKEIINLIRGLFREALKDNSNLNTALLTGILRVAKNNIFSDMNNITIYASLADNRYANYFGFTKEEVTALLGTYPTTKMPFLPITDLSEWYYGYRIGKQTLFNPWSMVNYLRKKEKYPQEYWTTTGENTLIQKALENFIGKEAELFKNDLEHLMGNGHTIVKQLNEHIVYKDLSDVKEQASQAAILNSDPQAMWSLLVLSGYLIARRIPDAIGEYELSIPNQELRVYLQTLFKTLKLKSGSVDLIPALRSNDGEQICIVLVALESQSLSGEHRKALIELLKYRGKKQLKILNRVWPLLERYWKEEKENLKEVLLSNLASNDKILLSFSYDKLAKELKTKLNSNESEELEQRIKKVLIDNLLVLDIQTRQFNFSKLNDLGLSDSKEVREKLISAFEDEDLSKASFAMNHIVKIDWQQYPEDGERIIEQLVKLKEGLVLDVSPTKRNIFVEVIVGNKHLRERLLDREPSCIRYTDENDDSCLMLMIKSSDLESAIELISLQGVMINLEQENRNQEIALLLAAKAGIVTFFQSIYDKNSNFHKQYIDKNPEILMRYAALSKQSAMIRYCSSIIKTEELSYIKFDSVLKELDSQKYLSTLDPNRSFSPRIDKLKLVILGDLHCGKEALFRSWLDSLLPEQRKRLFRTDKDQKNIFYINFQRVSSKKSEEMINAFLQSRIFASSIKVPHSYQDILSHLSDLSNDALHRDERLLFVFSNVFGTDAISDFIHLFAEHSIVITTCNRTLAKNLKFDKFFLPRPTERESLTLFSKLVDVTETDLTKTSAITQYLKRLGNIPSLVLQFSWYLEKQGIDPANHIDFDDQVYEGILKVDTTSSTQKHEAYGVALEGLLGVIKETYREDIKDIYEEMLSLAFYAPESISKNLIESKVAEILVEHSLLEENKNKDAYVIHYWVHRYLLILFQQEEENTKNNIIEKLVKKFMKHRSFSENTRINFNIARPMHEYWGIDNHIFCFSLIINSKHMLFRYPSTARYMFLKAAYLHSCKRNFFALREILRIIEYFYPQGVDNRSQDMAFYLYLRGKNEAIEGYCDAANYYFDRCCKIADTELFLIAKIAKIDLLIVGNRFKLAQDEINSIKASGSFSALFEMQSHYIIAHINVLSGLIAYQTDFYDNADKYFKDAQEIYAKYYGEKFNDEKNKHLFIALTNFYRAKNWIAENQYTSAVEELEKLERYCREQNLFDLMFDVCVTRAKAHYYKDEITKAEEHLAAIDRIQEYAHYHFLPTTQQQIEKKYIKFRILTSRKIKQADDYFTDAFKLAVAYLNKGLTEVKNIPKSSVTDLLPGEAQQGIPRHFLMAKILMQYGMQFFSKGEYDHAILLYEETFDIYTSLYNFDKDISSILRDKHNGEDLIKRIPLKMAHVLKWIAVSKFSKGDVFYYHDYLKLLGVVLGVQRKAYRTANSEIKDTLTRINGVSRVSASPDTTTPNILRRSIPSTNDFRSFNTSMLTSHESEHEDLVDSKELNQINTMLETNQFLVFAGKSSTQAEKTRIAQLLFRKYSKSFDSSFRESNSQITKSVWITVESETGYYDSIYNLAKTYGIGSEYLTLEELVIAVTRCISAKEPSLFIFDGFSELNEQRLLYIKQLFSGPDNHHFILVTCNGEIDNKCMFFEKNVSEFCYDLSSNLSPDFFEKVSKYIEKKLVVDKECAENIRQALSSDVTAITFLCKIAGKKSRYLEIDKKLNVLKSTSLSPLDVVMKFSISFLDKKFLAFLKILSQNFSYEIHYDLIQELQELLDKNNTLEIFSKAREIFLYETSNSYYTISRSLRNVIRNLSIELDEGYPSIFEFFSKRFHYDKRFPIPSRGYEKYILHVRELIENSINNTGILSATDKIYFIELAIRFVSYCVFHSRELNFARPIIDKIIQIDFDPLSTARSRAIRANINLLAGCYNQISEDIELADKSYDKLLSNTQNKAFFKECEEEKIFTKLLSIRFETEVNRNYENAVKLLEELLERDRKLYGENYNLTRGIILDELARALAKNAIKNKDKEKIDLAFKKHQSAIEHMENDRLQASGETCLRYLHAKLSYAETLLKCELLLNENLQNFNEISKVIFEVRETLKNLGMTSKRFLMGWCDLIEAEFAYENREYSQALDFSNKAVEILEKLYEKEKHIQTYLQDAYILAGRVSYFLGKYADAEDMFLKAMSVSRTRREFFAKENFLFQIKLENEQEVYRQCEMRYVNVLFYSYKIDNLKKFILESPFSEFKDQFQVNLTSEFINSQHSNPSFLVKYLYLIQIDLFSGDNDVVAKAISRLENFSQL